jgi:hypothetical protein
LLCAAQGEVRQNRADDPDERDHAAHCHRISEVRVDEDKRLQRSCQKRWNNHHDYEPQQ